VRTAVVLSIAAFVALSALGAQQAQRRLNPVIELLAQERPVFGLYAPSNRRGARAGSAANDSTAPKTPAQLARDALEYRLGDYLFDGSMEDEFDGAFRSFAAFVQGMADGGAVDRTPSPRLHHPLMVKTPKIAPEVALAAERIGRQLNLGVSGIVFVGVESADEVQAGLAAMRFRSRGGTRPDEVGGAPAFWGMSEQAYKEKADLWPLNPNGELINWTIVESKEGLAHVREIAAVPGIGVLFPGAGTLRRVFSAADAGGRRVVDQVAWEAAIQQVLAACQEFNVPCGYPATADDIGMRMQQGFSVFVINWGEQGFRAVEVGRRAARR